MILCSQIAGEPLDQGVVQYGPFGMLYAFVISPIQGMTAK